MKVIIAGSRGILDYLTVVQAVLDSGFNITELVSGGARGVDQLGEGWAKSKDIPIVSFIPDWSTGPGAGFGRNREMVEYADALIAVWDGKSRGTKHTIDTATKKGLKVYVHKVE